MTTEKKQEWNNWLHQSLINQRYSWVAELKFRRKLNDEEINHIESVLKNHYIMHPKFMIDHYGDSVCFCFRKI